MDPSPLAPLLGRLPVAVAAYQYQGAVSTGLVWPLNETGNMHSYDLHDTHLIMLD